MAGQTNLGPYKPPCASTGDAVCHHPRRRVASPPPRQKAWLASSRRLAPEGFYRATRQWPGIKSLMAKKPATIAASRASVTTSR
jgi:hypothetical protein